MLDNSETVWHTWWNIRTFPLKMTFTSTNKKYKICNIFRKFYIQIKIISDETRKFLYFYKNTRFNIRTLEYAIINKQNIRVELASKK